MIMEGVEGEKDGFEFKLKLVVDRG